MLRKKQIGQRIKLHGMLRKKQIGNRIKLHGMLRKKAYRSQIKLASLRLERNKYRAQTQSRMVCSERSK